MKNKLNARFVAQTAAISAIYVALTYLSSAMGLSSGAIQIRFSEALCILPVFTQAAVPGLFIGCILANTLTGSMLLDIIFGSLATLIGAVLTRRLKHNLLFATIPPILSNTIILPFVLKLAYNFEGALWYFAITVGIGEIISCGVLGYLLGKAVSKQKNLFN